jgi:hypothetical protein
MTKQELSDSDDQWQIFNGQFSIEEFRMLKNSEDK